MDLTEAQLAGIDEMLSNCEGTESIIILTVLDILGVDTTQLENK